MADFTRCIYGNKLLRPTPFVSISKNFQRTANGEIVGSLYNIVLNGTLVAWRGSPSASGYLVDQTNWSPDNFWTASGAPADESSSTIRFKALSRKTESIRNLFSKLNEGKTLQLQPCDGSTPLSCNPRIAGPITFEEGKWYNTVKYSVPLEADVIYGFVIPSGEDNFSQYIADANENWLIEDAQTPENENVQHTFRLTHNIFAQGKRFYKDDGTIPKEAWQWAREYVLDRLGIDNTFVRSSGSLFLPSFYGGFNHVRSVTPDIKNGSYSVTETWILSSGDTLEDFEISTDISTNTALKTVVVNGSVRGLETLTYPDPTGNSNTDFSFAETGVHTTKYTAAKNKFNKVQDQLHGRAQSYSGLTLNTQPRASRIGRNPVQGVINYAYTYDTRPSTCISGALSEVITISNNYSNDVFAVIPVLGRAAGPVLQDINTITETNRTLNVELVMPTPSACATNTAGMITLLNASPKSKVDNIVNAMSGALSSVYSQVFKSEDNDNWNPTEATYSRQVSWVFQ